MFGERILYERQERQKEVMALSHMFRVMQQGGKYSGNEHLQNVHSTHAS